MDLTNDTMVLLQADYADALVCEIQAAEDVETSEKAMTKAHDRYNKARERLQKAKEVLDAALIAEWKCKDVPF